MTEQEASDLLKRYKTNRCTKAETTLVEDWFMQYNEHEIDLSPELIKELGKQIYNELPGPVNSFKRFKLWPTLAAAVAVLILTLGIWTYFIKVDVPVKLNYVNDVSPGSNKATLTLANGKTINLSDAKTGVVFDDNKLTYNDGTAIASVDQNDFDTNGFQTISTPKGGEYQIVLSDGTKVWLNAESTLQYPAVFRERTVRKVKLLRGEAYFEVTKDKTQPFTVETKHQNVLVLGTHFNINAYEINSISTTLLEGSIRVEIASSVQHPRNDVLLKPGEQSINKFGSIEVHDVNTDLTVAWKNGKIDFRDANLKSIMKMLERWYNIEVIYNGTPTDSYYSGSVSRNRNISEVLQLLESTGEVHFKIDGRRIEVLK